MRPRGHGRTTAIGAAVLFALAMLGFTAPALGGAGPTSACRAASCEVRVKVGLDETKWRSIETFYPYNEAVEASLTARGRRLHATETWGPGNCRTAYGGSRIVAVVKACGARTPLRVRAYRMKRKRISLVITYRAVPLLRGDG